MTPRATFRETEADNSCPPSLPWPYEPSALMPDDWPTTRRHPRSLYSDSAAFPESAQYADPWDEYDQSRQVDELSAKWAQRVIALIGIGVLVALILGAI